MYKVSIITVCKNPGKGILKTLKSIEKQSYKNIQYIVIDGGSTDGTIEVLEKFKISGLINILIIESDNGIYSAINKGIKLASGDLVGIIHAGDSYTNDAILMAVNIFKEDGDSLSVLAGSMLLAYDDSYAKGGKVLGVPEDLSAIEKKMIFNHPSVFVKKRVYLDLGMYDESYKISADFAFLRKCFLMHERFRVSKNIFAIMSYGGISTRLSSALLIAKENHKVRFGNSGNALKCCVILVETFFLVISMLKSKLIIFFHTKMSRTLNGV